MSDCTGLTGTLDLSGRSKLEHLDISYCRRITRLNISGDTNLTKLYTGGRYASGGLTITGLTDESIIID
jgi:hypothetical protein